MEHVFQVLMLVGGITGIGIAALWSVAGAVGRLRSRQPADRGELAVMGERLARLEQAVESIAVEVGRVGEGQRFVTKLMADGRGLPGGGRPARVAR